MLILSRSLGHSIIIGGNIKVTVLETKPGKVRLGIDAPKDIIVDREEIHERRLAEPNYIKRAKPHEKS